MVILQLEVPLETVYRALHVARSHGVLTILNPAPAQPMDAAQLREVDYLIPNESEAEALTGMEIRSIQDALDCSGRLLDMGAGHVVITLGANGAVYASGNDRDHVPAFAVNAVDTSGAGDAFIGSFGFFLASGLDERQSIARANLYAALSTLRRGTRSAFASYEEWSEEWQARMG